VLEAVPANPSVTSKDKMIRERALRSLNIGLNLPMIWRTSEFARKFWT
jgi:hypothetical protein